MGYSFVNYPDQTGTETQFQVPFGYLNRAHVFVEVDGVPTAFTWVDGGTISVSPAPTGNVRVSRQTPVEAPVVVFKDGSTHSAARHNLQNLQSLYIVQESADALGLVLTGDGNVWDAEGQRIVNLGDPEDPQDAVTKLWAETGMTSQLSQAITARNTAEAHAAAALTSRNQAATSATNAANSASTATTQAGVATTKASEASASAGAASSSASTATTQAGIANTKAIEAAESAALALTRANTATTQANTATTQADIATTQAGIATTQSGIATTKASEAAASALSADFLNFGLGRTGSPLILTDLDATTLATGFYATSSATLAGTFPPGWSAGAISDVIFHRRAGFGLTGMNGHMIYLSSGAAPRMYMRTLSSDSWFAWREITANTGDILAQLALLEVGAVGSIAYLGTNANDTVDAGDTRAGSALRYAGHLASSAFSDATASAISTTAPAGTWRALGSANNSTGRRAMTLWIRIS